MLILGRKPDSDQSDILLRTSDGDIRIRVLPESRSGRVRLGFVAPAAVQVLRAELVERQREAA